MRIVVSINLCKRSREVDGNCSDEDALLVEAIALVTGLHSVTVAEFGRHRVILSADCVLDKNMSSMRSSISKSTRRAYLLTTQEVVKLLSPIFQSTSSPRSAQIVLPHLTWQLLASREVFNVTGNFKVFFEDEDTLSKQQS